MSTHAEVKVRHPMTATSVRRRWSTIIGALLLLLAASVVRSPADLLVRFGSHRLPVDERVSVAVPAGGMVGNGSGDPRAPRAAEDPSRPVTDGLVLREVRGGWRVQPGLEEAAALALLVGHRWMPEGTADGGEVDAAVDHRVVVIEAVEQPGASAAVITLLVASKGGEGATVHRVAVPIVISTHGAALGGAPWELPPPTHGVIELPGRTVSDPDLIDSARRALAAIGIDGTALTELEATDAWPFIARTATGTVVWLRWHVDRFVVTGLPLNHAT